MISFQQQLSLDILYITAKLICFLVFAYAKCWFSHKVAYLLINTNMCFNILQVDILCNDELLGKDHMLKFIVATRWRVDVSKITKMFVWL